MTQMYDPHKEWEEDPLKPDASERVRQAFDLFYRAEQNMTDRAHERDRDDLSADKGQ